MSERPEVLPNGTYHTEIDLIFESYLKKDAEAAIAIINTENDNKIIVEMNYDKVVFGHDMKIYKINKDGTLSLIDNPKFKAIPIKKI
jgi:hypothetical protein|tara:strand:- start:15463 stop:15723 length:261 start_codon:yes stop_codon:yes gene_type:complete